MSGAFTEMSYGPVELPVLVSWVKDERVTAETLGSSLRTATSGKRRRNCQNCRCSSAPNHASRAVGALAAGRAMWNRAFCGGSRFSLAALADEQLERFAGFVQAQQAPQWSVVVKQGDVGDSLFLILEGELRVRIDVAGRETILATLGVGEFFGDLSIFDQGPRSADVVANRDSLLVKVSAKAVEQLIEEAPETAAPIIFAMGRTLATRIRADNKRLGEALKFCGSF